MPKLPALISRKIYKTGQTRGADDDVIYQNRVNRNNTVLIPYQFSNPIIYPDNEEVFEKGFIVLVPPEIYFSDREIHSTLEQRGLALGSNCLVFYYTRADWEQYSPIERRWKPATSRQSPLGGEYIARVPATTAASNSDRIAHGFTTSALKGAGIRQYEYASFQTLKQTRDQLEAIFWLTFDSIEIVTKNGMTLADADSRRAAIFKKCQRLGLLDYERLIEARIIDKNHTTVCPLCRERLSALGFFSRLAQAEGREVPDLTVTEINLFHIEELRYGVYNHRPYNLGWGHHHCNVVVKDAGISATLDWMRQVLIRNETSN